MLKPWINQNFTVSRWAGDVAHVRCPIHDDQTASAAVFTESQWFYCQVCGSFSLTELETRTGLEAHPWDRKEQTPGAVYHYTDETGTPLYYKERFYKGNTKSFRSCRADGVPSLHGVRRVLYNLPKLKKALESNRTVFVVEGEKDADSLNSRGFVATTSDGGAGKDWSKEYFEVFPKGSTVYLVPDYDTIGFEYMRKISTGLKARGVIVKWIELPFPADSKKDITDYFQENREIESFHTLISQAKVKTDSSFKLIRACDIKITEPEWLIDEMFETDSLATVYGQPESGKSFIVLDMALSIATGLPFHGRETQKSPVIYLAGEGQRGIGKRIRAWQISKEVETIPDFLISERSFQLTDELSVSSVISSIKEQTDGVKPRLVVVDTLARNFGGADENSTKDMNTVIQSLDRIRAEFDCLVIVVHHSRKGPGLGARGSSVLRGAMDYEYFIEREEKTGVITMQNKKIKDGERPADIAFELVDIELGMVTRKGVEVFSACLNYVETPDIVEKKKKKATLKTFIMDVITMKLVSETSVLRSELVKELVERSQGQDWKKPNWSREFSKLKDSGDIVWDKNNDKIWTILSVK